MKKLNLLLLPMLALVFFFATSCGNDSPSVDDPVVTTYKAKLDVTIAGTSYTPSEEVTYTVKSYTQDGTNKVDIIVPEYTLTDTPMGRLEIGGYTVTGVCQIPGKKGCYSRDYSEDGLTFTFSRMDGGIWTTKTTPLNVADKEIITAIMSGTDIEITNCFQPEGMPMQIITTFDTNPED